MERVEAIVWLREYLADNIKLNVDVAFPMMDTVTNEFLENVWTELLVNKIIDRIEYMNIDPLTIVADLHYKFDEVLAESPDDHLLTHRFASFMEREAHDIYWYLKDKEEKKYGCVRQS